MDARRIAPALGRAAGFSRILPIPAPAFAGAFLVRCGVSPRFPNSALVHPERVGDGAGRDFRLPFFDLLSELLSLFGHDSESGQLQPADAVVEVIAAGADLAPSAALPQHYRP